MAPFHGLSAFAVTPTDPGAGRVDTDHLQRLVGRLDHPGVATIGLLGSTGSYMYLTPAERDRALRAGIEAAAKPVLAGIGAHHTAQVIAYARAAEDAGAAGLLLAPVSYLPLTDDDVFHLFQDVAQATGLPILVYNNPGTTHFAVSETLLTRLSVIPGVSGVKNPPAPGGDFAGQLARLRVTTTTGFSLGYSGDSAILGALRAGASAWYSVLAGTLPEAASRLWAARADDRDLAAAADPLASLLATFDRYGSIRVIHEVSELIGLGATPPPLPLRPLGTAARDEIATALAALPAPEPAQ